MPHIVFLSYFFTPDGLSTAVLMSQLAQDLQAQGNQLTVITTTPHYNLEEEALGAQPLRPLWGRWLQESELDGMRVLHVQVAPKGSRLWLRALDYIRYHLLGLVAGCFLVKDPDVLFVPSPPLTIGIHAWLLGMWHRIPFVYNVQEIYPDVAVKLGMLRNRSVIRLMERMEIFIYRRATKISVISEWFRRALASKDVQSEKLTVIPNFVDTEFVQPGERRNSLSDRLGLDGKFTVLYAGNIGLTQGFEFVMDTAQALDDRPEIHFLIIGGGARFEWVREQIAVRNLHNMTLLSYQPRSLVPQIYAAADLCLVPMKKGMAQDTFPSKIYTIMAAGRPTLASADEDSELAWVVQQADCGWHVPPDDAPALVQAIIAARQQQNLSQEKGDAGRRYVTKYHSRSAVAAQYQALIAETVNIPA